MAVLLLILLCWINLNVRSLARWIDGLTWWKLIVPVGVALTLMLLSSHWGSLQLPVGGTEAPMSSKPSAVAGFCSACLAFDRHGSGGEAQPGRDVPLAMGLGLGICLAIYGLLQLSFLVGVPLTSPTAGTA